MTARATDYDVITASQIGGNTGLGIASQGVLKTSLDFIRVHSHWAGPDNPLVPKI